MPLDFISFNVAAENCTVMLKWKYNSDENVDYFIVEKSVDGISFSKITTVKNTSESFVDVHPSAQKGFYRIKAVTVEHKNYITGTAIVQGNECQDVKLIISPNPANNFIDVLFPVNFKSGSYSIDNNSGISVKKGLLDNNIKNSIEINTLPNGVYIFKAIINNTTYASGFNIIH